MDREEMPLISTFRLPVQIHTRSANAKWLYEISHKNPVWIHPEDARRIVLDICQQYQARRAIKGKSIVTQRVLSFE